MSNAATTNAVRPALRVTFHHQSSLTVAPATRSTPRAPALTRFTWYGWQPGYRYGCPQPHDYTTGNGFKRGLVSQLKQRNVPNGGQRHFRSCQPTWKLLTWAITAMRFYTDATHRQVHLIMMVPNPRPAALCPCRKAKKFHGVMASYRIADGLYPTVTGFDVVRAW
jgi:hypothetical protein